MAGTYVFGIIIGKFDYWQELSLIILLVIDIHLKINFYNIILPLI